LATGIAVEDTAAEDPNSCFLQYPLC